MEDLSFGFDIRQDYALFIEEKHIKSDGWSFDDYVKNRFLNCEATFFRIIKNGYQCYQGNGSISSQFKTIVNKNIVVLLLLLLWL